MPKASFKLNHPIEFHIARRECNFDRACESAAERAAALMNIDEDGHSDMVTGWNRSTCSIMVTFVGYHVSFGMGGSEHVYEFTATAVKGESS